MEKCRSSASIVKWIQRNGSGSERRRRRRTRKLQEEKENGQAGRFQPGMRRPRTCLRKYIRVYHGARGKCGTQRHVWGIYGGAERVGRRERRVWRGLSNKPTLLLVPRAFTLEEPRSNYAGLSTCYFIYTLLPLRPNFSNPMFPFLPLSSLRSRPGCRRDTRRYCATPSLAERWMP